MDFIRHVLDFILNSLFFSMVVFFGAPMVPLLVSLWRGSRQSSKSSCHLQSNTEADTRA